MEDKKTSCLHKCFHRDIINLNCVARFYLSEDYRYITKTNGWDGDIEINQGNYPIEYTPMAKMITGEDVILGRSWEKKKNAQDDLDSIAFRKIDIHGNRADTMIR